VKAPYSYAALESHLIWGKSLLTQLQKLVRPLLGVDTSAPRRRGPRIAGPIFATVFLLSGAQAQNIVGQDSAGASSTNVRESLASALSSYESGNFHEATDRLSKVLQLDPNNRDALKMSAASYRSLGRYTEEAQIYDKIIAFEPTDAVTLDNRAVALFHLKRYSEMQQDFARANELNPNGEIGRIFNNSGSVQFALGNYQKAHDDFVAAELKGKSSPYLVWTDRILRQLNGNDLPPADWRPDINSYHTDLTISRPGHYLIDMPDKDQATNAPQNGVSSLAGTVGTRISFGGSADQPFQYAPGFNVWSGAVINDPQ